MNENSDACADNVCMLSILSCHRWIMKCFINTNKCDLYPPPTHFFYRRHQWTQQRWIHRVTFPWILLFLLNSKWHPSPHSSTIPQMAFQFGFITTLRRSLRTLQGLIWAGSSKRGIYVAMLVIVIFELIPVPEKVFDALRQWRWSNAPRSFDVWKIPARFSGVECNEVQFEWIWTINKRQMKMND